MKHIIIAISMLTAITSAAVAQTEEPGKSPRPPRPDPVELSNQLVKDFDHNGSGALNKAELTEALAALREARGPGPRGRPEARSQGPRQENQKPQRPPRGEGEQAQRPPRGENDQRPQRPQGGNMADMFLQRGDTDENGEMSATELASALQKMPRGRPGIRGQEK